MMQSDAEIKFLESLEQPGQRHSAEPGTNMSHFITGITLVRMKLMQKTEERRDEESEKDRVLRRSEALVCPHLGLD